MQMNAWEQEVFDVCEAARLEWERAVDKFGLADRILLAIEWYGASLAATQAVWQELADVHNLMPNVSVTSEEKRRRLNEWLRQNRQKHMEGFSLSGSSSVFTCAIENAQAEARSQMWRGTGAFAKIERILKESEE